MNDLSEDAIRTALAPRPTRYYAQAGSTNDLALDWLRNGAPTGSVVVADEQTSGRGRLGRAWYAPPGTALMLSVILRPPVTAVGRMTMLGAVAVCDLLSERVEPTVVGMKWPNDVRLNGRKVCGILPEAAWEGNRLLGVALGIGLNVRIDFRDTPFETTATSLESESGKPVDRLDLLVRLLRHVDAWAGKVESPVLYEAWRQRLTMLGQRVSVSNADGRIDGRAEAVDSQGALMLRMETGELRRVMAGDLFLGEEDGAHGD